MMKNLPHPPVQILFRKETDYSCNHSELVLQQEVKNRHSFAIRLSPVNL